MDNILTELWYGNVAPWEQSGKNDRETREMTARMFRAREKLAGELTDEQVKILEKYDDCANELSAKTERNAFIKGFSLGIRLLTAAMYTQTGE